MKKRLYSLGTSDAEQQRLHMQRELYGDTARVKFLKTDTVCEIGSGVGANLWIAQKVPRGRYIGIDVEPRQIEAAVKYARELSVSNVELLTVDAENTGLASDFVDVAFCRCVLIHQPDPRPLIDEMKRIAKPGGRLIIIEPHNTSYCCGPDKMSLMKCFHARTAYAYDNGRGSPDIALNLYALLTSRGLRDVHVEPHVITAYGREPGRCRTFLENWLGIIATVSDQLLEIGAVTQQELDLAKQEAESVTPETFVYQSMWIAEAIK